MVYSYFASKRGFDDTVGFSCNNIVGWCGHSVDYHKNKINDQVTQCINGLVNNEYITVNGNILSNLFCEAVINNDKFDVPNSFAIIYFNEIQKIRDFKKYTEDTNRMNSSILLLVLSYLRVNMLRRQEYYIGNESDKPEFCYRMYINIEKDIGLSNRYISRSVKILNEMNIIKSYELPRWKDENDNWHTEVTLFVNKYKYKKNTENGSFIIDDNYNYEKELQWGIDYIKEFKYLKKKFDQNTEK
jgi:hypothetical protein